MKEKPQILTIVFRSSTIEGNQVFDKIRSVFAARNVRDDRLELYGKRVTPKALEGRQFFDIKYAGIEFHLASIRNFQLSCLQFEATGELGDEWLAEFVGCPGFIMAWVSDADYQTWQNVTDIGRFVREGRNHEHLPKRSNGLPPPLERTEVDISDNPGRRILRPGYIEAVGYVMWIGADFWRLTGADQDIVRGVDWLRVSRPSAGVLRVQAADRPFTSADNEDGRLQRQLRSLLFPRSSAS